MAVSISTPDAYTTTQGAWKVGVADVTINTYATNGVSLTPADFNGITTPYFVSFSGGKGGFVFDYDFDNDKIIAYNQTDPAAAGGDNIALVEVDNGQDMSGVTVRVKMEGV